MGKFLDSTGLANLIGKIKTALGLKQDTLVSGTNIKTVNNQSLLGSGNIAISGGSSLPSGGAANDVLAKNSSTEGDLKWLTLGEVASLDSSDFGALAWEDSLTYSDVGAAAASHNHAASNITSGTLALARGGTASDNTARAINTVFAGPSSGSAGNASWRKLVAADIPALAISKITNLQTTLDGKQDAGDYWAGDKGGTNYWGLVNPDGSSAGWVRTPGSGLLPAASGGGSSSLGTSTWPFTNLYATNIYHNGTKLGSAATMNTGTTASTVALGNHTHSQYFNNSTSRTANTVLAAPNGSNGAASFRKLVAADIPRLDANHINLNGYSWVTGATPTAIGFSTTAYTSVATSGWTYYKFLANGSSMYVYHAFGVVKFKNVAITTAHGSGYINSANLYIRLPVKARVIKSATFGTAMGGGLLGVTLLAAGGTGDWKSTTDSLINLPVRLFSPVSQAAANTNNDNQFIPVDIWFTAAG